MKTKKKGFTLIEVIFAVAILGIVIVMIYPSMTSSFDLFRRAKDTDVVNNFATNKLETFKQDPVEFWKNVGYKEVSEGAYDKNDININQSKGEIYYYKYSYGNNKDFLYFDNDFNPISASEKDKAIYKMKLWGTKKSFSKVTSNLLPEKSTEFKGELKNIELNEEFNYFEAYKLPLKGENGFYDLGFIPGKNAKWVEDFLFSSDTIDSPSNLIGERHPPEIKKSYRELTAQYANKAHPYSYYMVMRNENINWFMQRFFRVLKTEITDVNFPHEKKLENFAYDEELDKDEVVNIIVNANSINTDRVTNIDFRNRLENPIELYIKYDARNFKPSGGQSVIEVLMNNIKLNVLDNDVNITFLSNESTLKNQYELSLELYRLDKKTNTEKKYEFKVKTLI